MVLISIWHRYEYGVRCDEGIDGHHPEGGHAVDYDKFVCVPDHFDILFQDHFAAHDVGEGDFQAGEFHVGWDEVNAFIVMQHAAARIEVFFVDDVHHDGCQRQPDRVRIRVSQADGQRALGVCVDQKDFLSRHGESDSEICCYGGLADIMRSFA